MQRLDLRQLLSQKLSPQQIQFIKLLQIPTVELEARIKEEMEINPALEEGREEPAEDFNESQDEDYGEDEYGKEDVVDINDYLNDDEISGYKMQGDRGGDEEEREMPIAMTSSLTDSLMDQLGFLDLDDR